MDKDIVKKEIRRFIRDNFFFGVDTVIYNDGDSLMAKGIVDSTGILELISYIETEYSIGVTDDELIPENLDSVINITQFIERKVLAVI